MDRIKESSILVPAHFGIWMKTNGVGVSDIIELAEETELLVARLMN
jgi:hypothetical protein